MRFFLGLVLVVALTGSAWGQVVVADTVQTEGGFYPDASGSELQMAAAGKGGTLSIRGETTSVRCTIDFLVTGPEASAFTGSDEGGFLLATISKSNNPALVGASVVVLVYPGTVDVYLADLPWFTSVGDVSIK